MPTNIKIALLVVGALLVIASVLSGALRRVARGASVVGGLCGVGLLAWALVPQLLTPQPAVQGSAAPAAAAAPATGAAAVTTPSPFTTPPARADLTLVASSAFADCTQPVTPGSPPDGSSASLAQMAAAQQAIKAYDAASTAYASCVDAATDHIVGQYQNFVSASELRAVRALDVKVHNAAVDQDKELVDRFNQQLHIFNARPQAKTKPRPNQTPLPPAP